MYGILVCMEVCDKCPHDFGEHLLVPYDRPENGGLILCDQLTGCKCASTWSVEGDENPQQQLPPEHVIQEYRDLLIKAGAGRGV